MKVTLNKSLVKQNCRETAVSLMCFFFIYLEALQQERLRPPWAAPLAFQVASEAEVQVEAAAVEAAVAVEVPQVAAPPPGLDTSP